MKRIFIAVDISEAARRAAASHVESLRREFSALRVGWERPEKLHLTLKFLGDTAENQLAEVEEAVARAAAELDEFDLRLGAPGVFPNERGGRVLWIGVEDEKSNLARIAGRLEDGCGKIGFAKERRGYRPHLTIARLKEPAASRGLVRRHLEALIEPVGLKISEIVIYESSLQPTGSIYRKLKTFALG